MNICIFFYCCAIIIPVLGVRTYGYSDEEELFEGSRCETENGVTGVCKRITECPLRLREALEGKRGGNAPGRCGFDGTMEIVCCADEINKKFNVRPAELACQAYENEVTSEISSKVAEITTRASGGQDINPFIYGGTRAVLNEFPYMAALGYENTDGEVNDPIVYDCGGALISLNYILTAAHCVSNINNKVPKWARVGSVDIRSPGAQEIPLKSAIPHPKYRRSLHYNDIALVSLETPFKLSAAVKPICLQTQPVQISSNDPNTSFVVIGFGSPEEGQLRSDKLMKSANLDLVPVETCNASITHFSKLPNGIDDTVICAKDTTSAKPSDACQGDSGGPLLMISGTVHRVIGVTSFGEGCGGVAPGGYTAVHAYIDWIESEVWPENIQS